jgi:hypothetical protein
MSDTTSIPDWLGALGLVVPALTGLVGYFLAGRNEEARDKRAAERERVAREAVRDERREDERHYFQRDTLLELQDVLQREARVAASIIQHDQATLKSRGSFTGMPAELNDESYDVGVVVNRLRVRVTSDELRDAVSDIHGFVSSLSVPAGSLLAMEPDEASIRLKEHLNELAERYMILNDLLGVHLRKELAR